MGEQMEAADFTQHPDVQKALSETRERHSGKQFSDIIDDAGNQYVDLVMEGGGVLGIALVGYTYVLEQMGIRFLRVGGTSAGSINALLLSALGTPEECKSEKIAKALANLPLYNFLDGNWLARWLINAMLGRVWLPLRILVGLLSLRVLILHLGLNPGRVFQDWVSVVLRDAGITSTEELLARMRTPPRGLRTRVGTVLSANDADCYPAIVAADVTTETKVEFPRMASLYWLNPAAIDPALYVRASMSIPFFFFPLRVRDVPQGASARSNWENLAGFDGEIPSVCTLLDGGIMSNFPIDLFHSHDRIPLAPTFGAKLGSAHRNTHMIERPLTLAGAVFDAARHTLDYDFIVRHPDYRNLVAHIDTRGHHWLNFMMTDKEKIDLFLRGARAAAEFLARFDWAQYKTIRAACAQTYRAAMV
jgi:NTE family protein